MGEAEVLTVSDDALQHQGRSVPLDAVEGFTERYSTWTGRAWLEVRGPGWRIPIGPDYGAHRAALRGHLPEHPFDSDWGDGRFPGFPGLPIDLATALALLLTVTLSVGASQLAGIPGVITVAIAAIWPLARLRRRVGVHREGLRIGPPWAAEIPWHEVREVCWRPRGSGVQIWIRGGRGGGRATLPKALLPALRARIRRLGGLRIQQVTPDAGDRYARWSALASALPWGILTATLLLAGAVPDPWPVLSAGLLVLAALTLFSAAVEARATGWGAGGVFGFTGVYAVILVGMGIGSWWLLP